MQPDHVINTHATTQLSAASLWETARTLGHPAALWRLPNQRDQHLIVSYDDVLPRVSADLEELPAGFAFSPFNNLDNGIGSPPRTLFLRADLHAYFPGNEPAEVAATPGETTDRFFKTLTITSVGQLFTSTPVPLPDSNAREQYVQAVAKAVAAMQRGEMRKVVLSRTKRVQFTEVPNAVELFDRLCNQYPTAFVSAVYLPEYDQTWISATPERLVSTDANGIFQTVSLAGTQSAFEPDGTPKSPPEAMWSQKEIEEQALVSRYIIECFKRIRLREYIEEGPKTIIAGNLMHLGTEFTVDTQAVHYPQLGTVMLRLLHPTSAVCGTPRDVAFGFINRHETHDREFYAGFLGPVNIPANHANRLPEVLNGGTSASSLFVHIRCMKLEGTVATLYAGAGLTENSIPEKEWLETEMKCQTLLTVLNK